MRLALDTNILAYAEGVNGAAMKDAALAIVDRLPVDRTLVPVQVLGELFNLLVRKAGFPPHRARSSLLTWHSREPCCGSSLGHMGLGGALGGGFRRMPPAFVRGPAGRVHMERSDCCESFLENAK